MNHPESLLEFKKEFSGREGIHLNSAGRSPISRTAAERISAAAFSSQTLASFADHEWVEALAGFRKNLAHFLGAESRDIAFIQNVASALSQAALGFPLRPADEVVVLDQEYASNFYPWKVACERVGAKLTVVASEADFANGAALTNRLLNAIRPGVKIVAVSWVQFQTGAQLDLRTIGEKAHSVGAFFVVDGIQGLGQLPIGFSDLPIDFLAGGSHKWMCGPLGQGFFAVKPEFCKLLQPTVIGCGTFNRFGTFAVMDAAMEESAKKFEPGGFNFVTLFGFNEAVQLLSRTGMNVVSHEIFRLSRLLREGLLSLKVNGVTPIDQINGITSIQLDPAKEARLIQRCREEQIAIAKRGNFIRFSLHAFCSEKEVERVLQVMIEVISEGK